MVKHAKALQDTPEYKKAIELLGPAGSRAAAYAIQELKTTFGSTPIPILEIINFVEYIVHDIFCRIEPNPDQALIWLKATLNPDRPSLKNPESAVIRKQMCEAYHTQSEPPTKVKSNDMLH